MDKLNQLLGIANNLADSFVSVTNFQFLKHTETSSVEKTKSLEIDILKETIKPEELMSKSVKDTIVQYKKWFLSEIDKFKINLNDIEKVIVKITYQPGKSFGRYYTCTATITAKGKDYTRKVMSFYS